MGLALAIFGSVALYKEPPRTLASSGSSDPRTELLSFPEQEEKEDVERFVLEAFNALRQGDFSFFEQIAEFEVDVDAYYATGGGPFLYPSEVPAYLAKRLAGKSVSCAGYKHWVIEYDGVYYGEALEIFVRGINTEFPDGRSAFEFRKTDSGWVFEAIGELRPQDEEFVDQEIKPEPCPASGRKRIVFEPGFGTWIFAGGAGGEPTFLPLRGHFVTRGNYGYEDFLNGSYTGGYVSSEPPHFWYPNEQICKDTMQDPEVSAENFLAMLLDHYQYHPEDTYDVFAHSNGTLVVLDAMELAVERGINLPITNIFLIDGPLNGLPREGSALIGQILRYLPNDCQGLFLPVPAPAGLQTPGGRNMVERWDNRAEVEARNMALVRALEEQDIRVWTVGNLQDCVYSIRSCTLGSIRGIGPFLADLFRTARLTPIWTQWIKNSHVRVFTLGRGGEVGHRQTIDRPEAQDFYLAVIGPQK